MIVTRVPRIAGELPFTPKPHVGERGFFSRTFDANVMREAGIDPCSFTAGAGPVAGRRDEGAGARPVPGPWRPARA